MLQFRSIALLFGICFCLLSGFNLFGNSKFKEENKMFLIILKYIKPLEDVQKLVPPHIEFLKKYYERSELICSGPRNPWDGGVILANVDSLEAAWTLVKEDPFFIHEIAEYEVIEFIPTMYSRLN